MKHRFITVALLAVLSIAAASCQKENIVELNEAQIQQYTSTRDVTFSIDGAIFHRTIHGEQQWFDFIDWILDLANDGHKVTFRDDNTFNLRQSSKDIVRYETGDKENTNLCSKFRNKNNRIIK